MKHMQHVKPWVSHLSPYVPGRTVGGMVKLSSNEMSYGPSPKVISGLKRKVKEVFRYPFRDLEVKEALARYVRVRPENIVLGSGSDELLEHLVKTFHGPIASHYPTFVEYPTWAKMHNVEYISSSLNPDFSFDPQRFIRETEGSRLNFLCTPNNPVGSIIDPKDIEKVAQTGRIVAVDEAYSEFWGKTLVPLVKDYPNVIVLKTMAKAFGLAGLRMGYAVAAPEAAEALEKVRAPFNVNYLAHEAALLALKDLPYMRRTVKAIVRGREIVGKAFAKRYRVVPSHANFIFADVSPDTPQGFFEKMMAEKIIVRPQPRFPGFPGSWVRVTIGTSAENRKLVRALGRI